MKKFLLSSLMATVTLLLAGESQAAGKHRDSDRGYASRSCEDGGYYDVTLTITPNAVYHPGRPANPSERPQRKCGKGRGDFDSMLYAICRGESLQKVTEGSKPDALQYEPINDSVFDRLGFERCDTKQVRELYGQLLIAVDAALMKNPIHGAPQTVEGRAESLEQLLTTYLTNPSIRIREDLWARESIQAGKALSEFVFTGVANRYDAQTACGVPAGEVEADRHLLLLRFLGDFEQLAKACHRPETPKEECGDCKTVYVNFADDHKAAPVAASYEDDQASDCSSNRSASPVPAHSNKKKKGGLFVDLGLLEQDREDLLEVFQTVKELAAKAAKARSKQKISAEEIENAVRNGIYTDPSARYAQPRKALMPLFQQAQKLGSGVEEAMNSEERLQQEMLGARKKVAERAVARLELKSHCDSTPRDNARWAWGENSFAVLAECDA